LLKEYYSSLVGSAVDPASPDVFPLLLKLIDPTQDLSVQVHPDDDYAGSHKEGELGKTEAWYVLQAAPGSKIYRGLKSGVTKDQLAEALKDGTVAELLNSFEAKAGDVVFLPAGMIHALGAGVKIAEIQQNSDTTYRVFDWNRVGLDGKPRELHIEHALAVTDFSDAGENTCEPIRIRHGGCLRERFIDCDKFVFERLSNFTDSVRMHTEGKRFYILTAIRGEVEVAAEGGRVRLGKWDSCLVPAGAGEFTVTGEMGATALLFYR
jgi:mannose-6-phosphate isomerase